MEQSTTEKEKSTDKRPQTIQKKKVGEYRQERWETKRQQHEKIKKAGKLKGGRGVEKKEKRR